MHFWTRKEEEKNLHCHCQGATTFDKRTIIITTLKIRALHNDAGLNYTQYINTERHNYTQHNETHHSHIQHNSTTYNDNYYHDSIMTFRIQLAQYIETQHYVT
jgi:hypothetical protein